MSNRDYFGSLRNLAAAGFAAILVSGCLMEEEEAEVEDDATVESRLSGSVGDGPIVGATLRFFRNDGEELLQLESDFNAGYNVLVSAKPKYFPIIIEATGGTDLVTNMPPDFILTGAAIRVGKKNVANINPFSTVALELAEELNGGLTRKNVEDAEAIVSEQLNAGLGLLAVTGPMATHIDETNVAEMVKASETLAEAVRRTRDMLNNAGIPTNADAVIRTLASDLVDEVIDGRGGAGVDARTAAVMTVVYAQVLMESMANELHVNGIDATAAMNRAINQVSIRTPATVIDDLVITRQMIDKALTGLAAAEAFAGSPAISSLHTAVSGVQAGMTSSLARSLLPGDYRTTLQNTIDSVASADMASIDMINEIARSGASSDSGNRAPTIAGNPAANVEVGSRYSFSPSAADPDNDTLVFSISNAPGWASFDSSSGELTGEPSAGDVATYTNIVISVSDGELSASLSPFSINVFQGNAAPTISGSPQTAVVAGQSYAFTPTASDPNGDRLSFSIVNQPSWASFNGSTGRLSGAPLESDVGTYANIVISVSDGELSASLPAFSINVSQSNAAPTISGTPQKSVTVGQSYAFTPTASDPNGDRLSFSIANKPSWASFDASTGRLAGQPLESDVGTHSNILISVSDGQRSASLEPFGITVESAAAPPPPPNQPPSISGNPPPEVNVGDTYTFTPEASDPDGDNLTFSMSYVPRWATFSTSTGTLTGIPGNDHVGLWEFLRMTVSDGSNTASIEFTILVNAVSNGSVTLDWVAPTENEDGSALTDLAGYRIYWGTDPGNYTDSVTVDNPGLTTYVVENLAPGTYEFVATSLNASGVESDYSNPVTKAVQ